MISTTGSNGDAFIETEKELAYFDPKIIIYNRVQKCGSRTILQAVRPILEFNKVAFEAKELKFYLTDEEQAQFRKDLGKVMTRPAIWSNVEPVKIISTTSNGPYIIVHIV